MFLVSHLVSIHVVSYFVAVGCSVGVVVELLSAAAAAGVAAAAVAVSAAAVAVVDCCYVVVEVAAAATAVAALLLVVVDDVAVVAVNPVVSFVLHSALNRPSTPREMAGRPPWRGGSLPPRCWKDEADCRTL